MELIKNLSTRKVNGRIESWAVFLCTICNLEVERPLGNGLKAKSCGCNRIESLKTHGQTYERLYVIWTSMKTRCLNPNFKQYKDYGGRGITICPEWSESYTKFRDWALSNGYKDNLQINRIKNDGNYEPGNCNFVTKTENLRNTRRIKQSLEKANEIRDLYATKNYTQKELAEKYNTDLKTINQIIHNKLWKN